jgi:dynein heavy chain, axonemal
MSPKSLQARVDLLIKTITYTSFLYTRRGLFEKHKIIVTAMLTFRILIRQGKLLEVEANHLIVGKMDPNPGQMPEVTKSYLNETNWALCKALESIPYFH